MYSPFPWPGRGFPTLGGAGVCLSADRANTRKRLGSASRNGHDGSYDKSPTAGPPLNVLGRLLDGWKETHHEPRFCINRITSHAKAVEKVVDVVNHTFRPLLEAHNLDLREYVPLQELDSESDHPSDVVVVDWRRRTHTATLPLSYLPEGPGYRVPLGPSRTQTCRKGFASASVISNIQVPCPHGKLEKR